MAANQNVVYSSKLTPLYTTFLHNIKLSGFDNSVLVAEQNNYQTKAGNAYIVFDLDDWPRIPLNSFKLKLCLFGKLNVKKTRDKSK